MTLPDRKGSDACVCLGVLYPCRRRLTEELSQLVIHGDAEGDPSSPLVNFVVTEMQLILGRAVHNVTAFITGERKTQCAMLCPDNMKGAQIPAELA